MTENKFSAVCELLPNRYHFDASGLKFDGKLIANYMPQVREVCKLIREERDEIYVAVSAILADGAETREIKWPLRQLDALNPQTDLDFRCYEYPGKNQQLVHNLIRYLATGKEASTVYYADTLGFLHYNGHIAYNAGSKIIGDLGVRVKRATEGYHFCPPSKVSDEQLRIHIKNILHLESEVTAPIFAYFILGILRDLFREAGVPIHFCMYLVGEQQSMKTTLATYLCSLYDRHEDVEKHVHNLTATEVKLHEVLHMEKDMVSIIDDLNLDDSKRREREQEAKLSGLIRAAANGVGRETIRGQSSINAQPLFCGEYLLKNTSTNNRLLIVHLEQGQINKDKLFEIQKDRLLLTAFAEQFISWVLEQYTSLCQSISKHYDYFLELRADGIFYQERLNRSAAVLSIAYKVFQHFCKARGWDVGLNSKGFDEILKNLIEQQIKDLELQNSQGPDYVIELYRHLRYEQDYDCVCRKRPNDKIWIKEIYFDDKNRYVYILSCKMKRLSLEISKKSKVTNYHDAFHKMLNALEAEGILLKDRNKNGTRSKKVGGKRCYVLDYDRWKQYLEEVAETWDAP